MVLPARMLPHRITIVTPAEVLDEYGNTVHDWDAAATRTVAAYVRPAGTSIRPAGDEYVAPGRDVIEAAWQVHVNDLDVTALDRVIYDGVTYDVDGQPLIWRTLPGGRPGHTKLLLRRIDG